MEKIETKNEQVIEVEQSPGYSEVSFELITENETTTVRITHTGLSSFRENGPDFATESFAGGWDHILNFSLKDHLEKTKP